MRPTFDRRLWILLFIILLKCITIASPQNINHNNNYNSNNNNKPQNKPADKASASAATTTTWSISQTHSNVAVHGETNARRHALSGDNKHKTADGDELTITAATTTTNKFNNNNNKFNNNYNYNNNNHLIINNKKNYNKNNKNNNKQLNVNKQQCANNNCLATTTKTTKNKATTTTTTTKNKILTATTNSNFNSNSHKFSTSNARHSYDVLLPFTYATAITTTTTTTTSSTSKNIKQKNNKNKNNKVASHSHKKPSHSLPSSTIPTDPDAQLSSQPKHNPAKARNLLKQKSKFKLTNTVHVAHRNQHKEVRPHAATHRTATLAAVSNRNHNHEHGRKSRTRRAVTSAAQVDDDTEGEMAQSMGTSMSSSSEDFSYALPTSEQPRESPHAGNLTLNAAGMDMTRLHYTPLLTSKAKRTVNQPTSVVLPPKQQHQPHEPIIIIDDVEEFDSGTDRDLRTLGMPVDKSEDYSHDEPLEPRVLPLRPVLPNPYDDEEMSVVYAEQHSEIRLMCEVDLDIASSMWYKNGQVVHAMDRTTRVTDYRFIKETNGALTITNVMLEDDGKWQCEAENTRRYIENARPVKLVVLDRPKPPYLLIDSRRLDAGNIFVPVKENSELNLTCVSEGGNPKPTLTWEVLLSPGVDRHAQKLSADSLELEEIKYDKDKNAYKINSGAKSEARLPVVYRAHHNARILCVMEHPTLKIRQNASLLLDVQYTPSFAISRSPGFGYPLREGIEVSLKCDVDSNPPSMPRWQKDDGDTPVLQNGDGFLNFTSIRREHSGWYKCTSRHLNFQYSSIGYYLSVRYDSVDVTSEPDDQDISVAAASHNPNKGQLEVQLGGAVTLQCPQGSLGCWSHLDPMTARLRGLGHGLSTPTGQFSLKDVVYQDAGTYKCIGQSPVNKKKLEVLQTVGVLVKGAPTVVARNATPVAYPGSPLHLTVEFCANPPAHAARWLHGDRVYTPGNQYGNFALAYGVTDLPTPYCKEARLTYVSMHERVVRTFYFIVSTPVGVAEAVFKVNFTMRYRTTSNAVDDNEEEELSEPEEIHFPVFGAAATPTLTHCTPILLLLSSIGLQIFWSALQRRGIYKSGQV